jgi:hypothetical protein
VTELDTRVRVAIYERFVGEGAPPSASAVADELSISEDEAQGGFRRLDDPTGEPPTAE